jgi:mannose-6-phosphate isomerase-like protein (cupin superfamily)
MSRDGHEPLRVLHVPSEGGEAISVYGDTDIIKVASEETAGALTFMETVVPPHAGPPLHIHRRESEAIYVLDGDLKIVDGDRSFLVANGGFVYMPQGSTHRFENVRDTPSTILLFFIPAGFEGYLKEMAASVTGDESVAEAHTDLAKAARIGAKYGMEIVEEPPPE